MKSDLSRFLPRSEDDTLQLWTRSVHPGCSLDHFPSMGVPRAKRCSVLETVQHAWNADRFLVPASEVKLYGEFFLWANLGVSASEIRRAGFLHVGRHDVADNPDNPSSRDQPAAQILLPHRLVHTSFSKSGESLYAYCLPSTRNSLEFSQKKQQSKVARLPKIGHSVFG